MTGLNQWRTLVGRASSRVPANRPPRWLHAAILCWSGASAVVAFLPHGAGGVPRAVNAIVFLMFGPGCALALGLRRRVPFPVVATISLGASLPVLVVSSQLLLILRIWSPWGVTAVVGLVTVGLLLVPVRLEES